MTTEKTLKMPIVRHFNMHIEIDPLIAQANKEIAKLDQTKIKQHEQTGRRRFSLPQIAAVCGQETPALNYYEKMGVVECDDDRPDQKKRYFDYAGLLTFFVMTRLLKHRLMKVEKFKGLQKKLARLPAVKQED